MIHRFLLLLAFGGAFQAGALRADEPAFDAYGVPLPKGAKARLGMLHEDARSSAEHPSVVSPDGKLLAVMVGNGIEVWDLPAGGFVHKWIAHPYPYSLHNLVFADNDILLTHGRASEASPSEDMVKAWNARSGKMTRSFAVPEKWKGTAFSHDGKLLAFTTAGRAQGNTLHVWDTRTGKQLYSDTELYPTLFFTPDDRLLIACSLWNVNQQLVSTITFRAARTGKVVRKLELKEPAPAIASISSDGKYLLGVTHVIYGGDTSKYKCHWQLFDAETGKAIRTIVINGVNTPRTFAFSPDGRLVTGLDVDNRTVCVWEAATGKKTHTLQGEHDCYPWFGPGGKTLVNATKSGRVYLHDLTTLATRDLNPTHTGKVLCLAFTPDSKQLASGSSRGEIYVWETATGAIQQRCHLTSPAQEASGGWDTPIKLAFAPDGKHLLVQDEKTVRLLAPFRGRELPPSGGAGQVYGFSEDGRHLLWTTSRVHNIAGIPRVLPHDSLDDPECWLAALQWTAQALWWRPELRQFRTHVYMPPNLNGESPLDFMPMNGFSVRPAWSAYPQALSPDGSVMLERVQRLTGNPSSGRGTYWVPDGVRFADVATGQEIYRTKAEAGLLDWQPSNGAGAMLVLQLSPDSRSMVCTGPYAKKKAMGLALYEVRSGKVRLKLSDEPVPAGPVAFTRGGNLVAFANAKNMIEVWDLTLGKNVAQFASADQPAALAFSPDGSLLASGSTYSGIIMLWDCSPLVKRHLSEPAWTDDDKSRLWHDLALADAAGAYAAMMRLKRNPAQGVALLRGRLRWEETNAEIGRLIGNLGSADFATRQKASDTLEQLGDQARPQLVKFLKETTTLEHKRRAEWLIDRLGRPFTSNAGLRLLRSVEVLDGLRTVEAAALLRQIAADATLDESLASEVARALQRSAALPNSP
jgi:WD40 repeat protein